MTKNEKLRYETLAQGNETELDEEQKKAAREEAKKHYEEFKPFKDLFECKEWKAVVPLMEKDIINTLHYSEDHAWLYRSWGMKMFLETVKLRAEMRDQAEKILSEV